MHRGELEKRLAALPDAEITRISIARSRGRYPAGEGEDLADYAWLVELGGFQVSAPCTVDAIRLRYGPGSYRVTAYGFDPAGPRWGVLVEDLA